MVCLRPIPQFSGNKFPEISMLDIVDTWYGVVLNGHGGGVLFSLLVLLGLGRGVPGAFCGSPGCCGSSSGPCRPLLGFF